MVAPRVGTIAAILNIWLVCWAIRKRGEVDLPIDQTVQAVRWLLGSALTMFPFALPKAIDSFAFRVCVGFAGLAFLCWPNLAVHLVAFLRRFVALFRGV